MFSSTFVFLISLSSLALAVPQPRSLALSPRTCGTVLSPSNYYQIYEEPDFVNQTSGLGPFSPNGGYSFAVSQQANNVNERDLIASFKNVPCPPTGRGPYTIEFVILPGARYTVTGTNTRVDMFAINGDLPSIVFPDGSVSETPTWVTTNRQTGALIGTFTLPATPPLNRAQTFIINSVTCKSTINLRFSLTNDVPAAGNVNYFHGTEAGLRIRYGC
ncbi:MAG: hypothetical protein Q9190_001712 [Brigantiaea leucoxantha]